MKICLLISLIAILSVGVSTVSAVDYTVDPTFNPTFVFPEFNVERSISDMLVLPDGKVLVGGNFSQVNGEAVNYLVRLNPDGSRDTTFNSGIIPSSGFLNYVTHMTLLPDGKYLVTGKFKVNGVFSGYVKLNSDGSIDNTGFIHYAFLSDLNQLMIPLPDGKFLVCGGRLINDETYWLAHRLNADGSTDPSFRINTTNASCFDMRLLPDGKILIAGSGNDGPLRRYNPDGSLDPTFVLGTSAPHPITRRFEVLANGKIMASYADSTNGNPGSVRLFNSDGSLDRQFDNCGANEPAIFPMNNGNVWMSGCRKWTTGHIFQFAEMRQNGTPEPSLDWINFEGMVNEIRAAGNGKFYVSGPFTRVNGATRTKIARLMPYQAPIKPQFDFDGDGKADLAVFRQSDRYWYLFQSTAGPSYTQWGLSTDVPIAAHYDLDDKTDIGVYRDTDAVWHSMSSGWGYTWLTLGERGKPFVGDFDGNGKQDWAIRKVLNGDVSWLVTRYEQRGFGYSTSSVSGQTFADISVVGDFDGDARDEVGYFRDGVWYTRDYGSGAPTQTFQWGATGDIPVPADYDGDGQDDYAVFRPSTGVWWINQSSHGVFVAHFGANGDVPVPADYDGDSKVDIAIFRGGQWWQYRSNGGIVHVDQWGIAGDIPIPAQGR